jgi:hypothetical protein
MRKLLLLLPLLAVGLIPTIAGADPPEGLHCPDHNSVENVKDSSGADDNDLVLEEGLRICVKAGSEESGGGNTGIIYTDGESTLQEYLFAAGIVDGSGEQGRDVSYWVQYPPVSVLVCIDDVVVEIDEFDALEGDLTVLTDVEVGDDCGVVEETTTTTTTIETTTTTETPVVPTEPEVPVAPVVVTAAPAPVAAPLSVPAPVQELPRTGGGIALLAGLGSGLSALGLVLRRKFGN